MIVNEYQQKRRDQRAQFEAILRPICDALSDSVDTWNLETVPSDWKASWAAITDSRLGLLCEFDRRLNRIEFRASTFPHYTDAAGRKQVVSPRDIRESAPTTTARADRHAVAIARQITNKVLVPYNALHERLEKRAEDAQKRSDAQVDSMKRLADACGVKYIPGRAATYYVQNLPGSTVRVEYRSPGSVRFDVDTDVAIAIIALLRERRTSEAA